VLSIETASLNDLEGIKLSPFVEWDRRSLNSNREGIREEDGRQKVAEVKEGSKIGKYNFLYLGQNSI
jgi:hypothetical protein